MNNTRFGNFSSSEIHKLMAKGKSEVFGKPALTYIQEKRYEMKLGRPLSTDNSSRHAMWGAFVEQYVHENHVGFDWIMCSQERLVHPTIAHWTGAPDLLNDETSTVGDIKCPQLKSFCELSEICLLEDVEKLKSDYPEYFWQLVSNAILTNSENALLIIFVPYQDELKIIREMAMELDDKKFNWIAYASDDELPYLPIFSDYKNTAQIRFKVSNEYILELENRVKLAVELLE